MVPLARLRQAERAAARSRSARALLLAASLGLAIVGPSPAPAATFGIDLYGLSRHFARHSEEGERFNEVNAGLGVNCVLLRTRTQSAFADLSIYRDSFRQANRYVSIAWTHRVVGDLQAGAMLAVASTRSANLGEPFMAPVPMLSYRTDRAAIQLLYLPPSSELSIYPSVAMFATGYPFGAARVDPHTTAAGESEPGLGIEFSAGRRFTLERLGDAELALRRRSGARGWRLGLDLSALVGSTQTDTLADTVISKHESGEVYDLRLRVERTFHSPTHHGASVMTGVGPLLGYTNEDPLTLLRTWRIGVGGSLGLEWRVAPALSLLAETGWELSATIGRGEFGSPADWTEIHYERFTFAPRAARIGITAWTHALP